MLQSDMIHSKCICVYVYIHMYVNIFIYVNLYIIYHISIYALEYTYIYIYTKVNIFDIYRFSLHVRTLNEHLCFQLTSQASPSFSWRRATFDLERGAAGDAAYDQSWVCIFGALI